MYKNIIQSIIFFFLFQLTFSQVGIGIENPIEGLEVVGSVKLRNLSQGPSQVFNNQLMSDEEGNLTAVVGSTTGLIFADFKTQFMESSVSLSNGTPIGTLGMNSIITVEPFTEVLAIITYNIPIYIKSTQNTNLPDFGGVKLYRNEEGSGRINLFGGDRKFSFPAQFYSNITKKGVFIDGKYVDIIINNTQNRKVVTYSLDGMIQGNSSFLDLVFFGDNDITNQTMGRGVMSVMVFSKTF